jgi:predicted DNA-binding transcriptional regulator YafY
MKTTQCSSGSARPADAGPLFAATAHEAVARVRTLSQAFLQLPKVANMPAERLRQVLKQHQGKGNAITSRQLAQRLGISTREVREIIAALVEDGALIGASVDGDSGGYYVITTPAELEETRAILRSRAQHIFARDAALRRTWQREHGQELQPLLPQLGALSPE